MDTRLSGYQGMKKNRKILAVLVFLGLFFPVTVQSQSLGKLLVFTSEYCSYCQEFMKVIAPIYPKTKIGKTMPLIQVDNFDTPEEYQDLVWEVRYVPTFLVMDAKGKEIGRFSGYRGEEFFWSDLESIVTKMAVR